MSPRETNYSFANRFLTIEYDATAVILLPHHNTTIPDNDMQIGPNTNIDDVGTPDTNSLAYSNDNFNNTGDRVINDARPAANAQSPIEALCQSFGQHEETEGLGIPAVPSEAEDLPASMQLNSNASGSRSIISPIRGDAIQDIDPLAIDTSDSSNDQDTWNLFYATVATAPDNVTMTTSPSPTRHILDPGQDLSLTSCSKDEDDVPGLDTTVDNSTTASGSTSIRRSNRSIPWNSAFDFDNGAISDCDVSSLLNSARGSNDITDTATSNGPRQVHLSFGPNTTISDLKYFAERGCIVPLLRTLDSPRLKSFGTRMLADYAKMPSRRAAVASNKRILEWCCRMMLEMPTSNNMGTEWPAREYAVETIRNLTATEGSDGCLMECKGLLKALSIVARGGPFVEYENSTNGHYQVSRNMGLVSGKARLNACMAIGNLSCGRANKLEIASITEVIEAMRDVMMAKPETFSPVTSLPIISSRNSIDVPLANVAAEAILKATSSVKNLSNAERNDAALLNTEGLIEALAHVATDTCAGKNGATTCTTSACLALMNLSISKANKHKVFRTKGVMDALMTVLQLTSPNVRYQKNANNEAQIAACSALSSLANGYENKIPMFNYPGFVSSILQVIQTDSGEARTKACSILWSFATERKNQLPVSL